MIIDAVKRVADSGKPVTRDAVRDAIQTAKVKTAAGPVSFDENGDLEDDGQRVPDQEGPASRSTTDAVPVHRRGAQAYASRASAWPGLARPHSLADLAPAAAGPCRHVVNDMTDLLLQQAINGLSLGAMYALLALGFTLVYGILELINFAHFNVFMVGSFIAMGTLQALG